MVKFSHLKEKQKSPLPEQLSYVSLTPSLGQAQVTILGRLDIRAGVFGQQ